MRRSTLPMVMVAALIGPSAALGQFGGMAIDQGGARPEARLVWKRENLTNPDPNIRAFSLQAMGPANRLSRDDAHAVAAMLKDPAPSVRAQSAWVFSVHRREAARSIDDLAAAVRAAPDRRCPEAVRALANVGRPAIPALIAGAHDRNPKVRQLTVQTLGQLDDPAPLPVVGIAIGHALIDPDAEVRASAAESIARYGERPETVAAVPMLLLDLFDGNDEVSEAARKALDVVGGTTLRAALKRWWPVD